jgi:hypothetical protein
MRQVFFWIFLTTFHVISSAQQVIEKPIEGQILAGGLGLGFNTPMEDLKDRYGPSMDFGINLDYVTASNWIFGGQFAYFFGDNVKIDPVAPYRTAQGWVLGDNNQESILFLKQRGLFLGGGIGKLFQLKPDSRTGIKFMVQAGVLQHHIRFADEDNSVVQIRAGRHTRYDRLARGFALKETVAYKMLSSDRRMNFELALDFTQGFTSDVRAYHFDTGLPGDKNRLDLMIGLRLSYYLPFYFVKGEREIFY